jgi:UDP-GlcNAc:undecaprenyl-phosphate GlcNAc-1-phosphate transferase
MIKRVRILDHPNDRSSHSVATPRSGGIAIVATFFIGLVALKTMSDDPALDQNFFWIFVGASGLIAVISIFDDLSGMGFRAKLVTQAFAALAVMAFGVVIDRLYVPGLGQVELGVWGYALTFLWIVGLTNAFNFMDGIDGIAAGTALVASAAFAIVTLSQGSTFIYLVSLIVAGSAAGFLFWNWQPAKIFMGDSGSQFLGFVLAVMAVMAGRFDASHTSYLVMPLLFLHFIWDTAYTFQRRLRNGERVTQAHRTHIYQLMTQLGFQHVHVTLVYVFVGALQGVGAMMLVHLDGPLRILVFVPFIAFQAVITMSVMKKARAAGLVA